MKTSDILYEAANVIERDGWFRLFPTHKYGAAPACALVAISRAAPGNGLAAYYALSSVVGTVAAWNDGCANEAEVTSTLRATAAVERARESAMTDVRQLLTRAHEAETAGEIEKADGLGASAANRLAVHIGAGK